MTAKAQNGGESALQPHRHLGCARKGQGRGAKERASCALICPARLANLRRSTHHSNLRAPAGLLPLAPPSSPPGFVAAFVVADSSRTPGRSSWIRVVQSTLRGMRPIFRLPGLQLPSLTGRRPRQGRYPRPRGSLRSTCSESANADAVPAGPRAGGGGVWCARRGGGGGGAPPPPPLRGRVSRCRRRRRRLTPLRCCARWGEGEPLATSG